MDEIKTRCMEKPAGGRPPEWVAWYASGHIRDEIGRGSTEQEAIDDLRRVSRGNDELVEALRVRLAAWMAD